MSLKRNVGLVALSLYGIGDILGAGIYGLIGKAAAQMGNGIWLAFLASMVVAMFSGLSYAAVGSRFPRAAGAAYVTQKAFNRSWLTYLVGLSALASGLTSMATASRVFAGYFQAFTPNFPTWVLIFLFATALFLIVLKGIRESMWVNSIFTLIEVGGLFIIIFLGFKIIGNVNYLDMTSPMNPSGELAPALILNGAVLTFYSFIGFEDILNVSEEVKDPKRTIPRALITAILVSSIIYILISLIAVSAVSVVELSESNQPLVQVVKSLSASFPDEIFTFIAIFAVSNTALLNFIMGSRLLYGMSQQGLLPKILSRVNPKTSTPHAAIGIVYIILLLLAFSGNISSLAKATSVLLLICFIMVNLALIRLKRQEKKVAEGVFDVPLLVPVFGAITSFVMICSAQAPELKLAIVILLVIAGLYLIKRPQAIDPEILGHIED